MKEGAINSNIILTHLMLVLCSVQSQLTPLEPKIPSEGVIREIQPNAYCGKDDPVPIRPPVNCSVCEGQCGLFRNIRRDFYCSCDSACVAYGDCCMDFEQSCPIQYAESRPLQTHFQHRRVDCYTVFTVNPADIAEAGRLGFIIPDYNVFNFVSICGQSGVVCNRTRPSNILDSNYAIPVTDPRTGIDYVNYECAKCNNVNNIIPWIPHVSCNPKRVPLTVGNASLINQTVHVENLESILLNCNVHYIIPQNVTPREFCLPVGNELQCPSSCNNTKLVELCDNSTSVDFFTGRGFKTYKNYYCALCAAEPSNALRCARIFYTAAGGTPGPEVFSLSLLFDFDPSEGITVGRKACSTGQKWVASTKECRQVICPEDRRLVNATCLSGSLELQLTASLQFNRTNDLENIYDTLNNDTFSSMQMQLVQLLPGDKLELTSNKTILPVRVLNITLGFQLIFSKNSTFNFGDDLKNFTDTSIDIFKDELILLIQRSGINLGYVVLTIDENVAFNQAFITDCTWFHFRGEEFEVTNGSLLIKSSQMTYTSERFSLLNTDALVCLDNTMIERNDLNLDVSPALGILTVALISLSILCLIIRLALQSKIRYFWSFAGKLQFNLALSLCLAFTMLLLGGVVSMYEIRKLCMAFAILMYWFFLAAFCWMAAITVDTWQVFRPSANFVKASDTRKSLARYVVPCWLLSALIAIIVMALDLSGIEGRFKPQFGSNICWFNQRYALLVYFGIPVAILTLLTTIFFIMIVVNVRQTLQSTVKTNTEKSSHQIWIYCRLFSLIGVSWVFGFVAAFVGHDALWIIFIILNASQGILIFVSFVLNQQVLKEMKKHGPLTSTSSTTATSSTLLNSTNRPKHSAQRMTDKSTTSI